MKKWILLLTTLLLSVPTVAWTQINPPPFAAYVNSGSGWVALTGTGSGQAINPPPPAAALYVQSAGQWIPWTGTGGGGGTTTNPLTGAVSGGAAPGSTFNGASAVTFDYHTLGAPGIAAANLFTGLNTFSGSATLPQMSIINPQTGSYGPACQFIQAATGTFNDHAWQIGIGCNSTVADGSLIFCGLGLGSGNCNMDIPNGATGGYIRNPMAIGGTTPCSGSILLCVPGIASATTLAATGLGSSLLPICTTTGGQLIDSGCTNPGSPIGQYSSGVTYSYGDFAWDASGFYYQSLVSSNTGNALPVLPTVATSFWRNISPGAGIIAGGTCTNQFASAISTAGVPTCTTVTPAYAAGNTTGSGNFVLATSPTLVTPALGTPTALVLTSATGLPTAGLVNNAVTSAKMAVANTYRTCDIPINDTSGSAITSGQMGPQSRVCFIPAASTIVEMDVNADAGTPNIIVGRNHAGTITNIVSGALATAASGGIACSNTGGTTGINGATTCSSTLQNTSLAAGDYLELVSGTPGGTAKFFVAHVIYTVN